jgi:PHP family Zn ribbon phosphoesterase
MKLAVDLHSHSGYAGGVGQIELSAVSKTMKLKGIDVFGTGDCLFLRFWINQINLFLFLKSL